MISKLKNIKLSKLGKLILEQYGASKSCFFIYSLLRIIVIAILVISIVKGRYEHTLQCLLTLLLFCLPPFFERTFKADLPDTFEIIVLLFAFSANILGEIFSFYTIIPIWDLMLHTVYGFIFAALGFSLIDLLNKDTTLKFKIHPSYFIVNSIGFTLGVGVFWEFFEFTMDNYFGKDMQKDTIIKSFQSVTLDETNTNTPVLFSNIKQVIIDGQAFPFEGYLDIGLYDTIEDLAVALLGAVVFCFFLVPYLKSKGNNKFASMFIPVKRNWKENPADIEVELANKIINLENELENLKYQKNTINKDKSNEEEEK